MSNIIPFTRADMKAVLDQNKNIEFHLCLLDKSGSMNYGDPDLPRRVFNDHLHSIKEDEEGAIHFVTLITFGDGFNVDIPLRLVSQIEELRHYSPSDAYTHCHYTVDQVLRAFLECYLRIPSPDMRRVCVKVDIITDGCDNGSNSILRAYPKRVREISKEVRRFGWFLNVHAIGYPGHRIAEDLGFKDGFTRTYEASTAGVREAGRTMIHTSRMQSTLFFTGGQNPTHDDVIDVNFDVRGDDDEEPPMDD